MDITLDFLELILTFLAAVAASSGLWMYLMKKSEKKDNRDRLLMGLAHDRILYLGMKYIERGWITRDEYENVFEYLYNPYLAMGGNGSAKKVMDEVNKLPIRETSSKIPRTGE